MRWNDHENIHSDSESVGVVDSEQDKAQRGSLHLNFTECLSLHLFLLQPSSFLSLYRTLQPECDLIKQCLQVLERKWNLHALNLKCGIFFVRATALCKDFDLGQISFGSSCKLGFDGLRKQWLILILNGGSCHWKQHNNKMLYSWSATGKEWSVGSVIILENCFLCGTCLNFVSILSTLQLGSHQHNSHCRIYWFL